MPTAEFAAGSDEPQNHNKKHRQDKDPPDKGVHPSPDVTPKPTHPLSYKDTLLGDQNHAIHDDEVFPDEEDIDLNEGDVTRGFVDGLITIDFSDRVHDLAVKSLEQTIVIKILGRRIGYTTRGINCLPVTLYKRSLITELGEYVGRVLKLDYQTETGQRGRFARMAVRVDLNKPLVSKIVVNGRVQLVEYESLPLICFHCGKYGHGTDTCPTFQTAPATEAPTRPSTPETPVPTTMFGPWMVVEKRQRRPQSKESAGKGLSGGVTISESRFTPILDENSNDPPLAAPNVSAVAHHFATPNTKQSAIPKRSTQGKSIQHKQSVALLKRNNKPTVSTQQATTFHVRKPLQLNLGVFPILPRHAHKASSSKHPPSSLAVSRLDKSRHSSVTLHENSDSNILNSEHSMSVNNMATELPAKPPDPIISAPPISGHMQGNVQVDMPHDAHSSDVPVMIGDTHGSAMLE
ncbi:hypothetical protein GQ457_02G020520 [Hibiscus cannabinus]